MYRADDHTFVVCAYGESAYLGQAVDSALRQTAASHVLVATSTPNEHVRSLCEARGLPLVVNEGESSIARDWNYGYDSAGTPLVTIVHQDDIYEPDYLQAVLDVANSSSDKVGVIHTDYYEIRQGERVDSNRLLRIKRALNKRASKALSDTSDSAAKRKAFRLGNFICCPSVTFVRDVVGPSVFDVEYANSCDYRTWLNLAQRNVAFAYVPKALMGHRIHAESTTTANIANSVRASEDLAIMESLWPKPMAKAVHAVYVRGEKSNRV